MTESIIHPADFCCSFCFVFRASSYLNTYREIIALEKNTKRNHLIIPKIFNTIKCEHENVYRQLVYKRIR